MKYKNILLIILISLGFILRIINLNISPPGFNADEAALGYNAYSILKTGKDEWGETFPIVFKSFDDYKPGLYVYLTIPFIVVFGLSELTVRFPSIILGTISILLIYLLSKQIFKNEISAFSSAFLLAISPWHLHFSRGAWETNVGTFFILLGVYGFVKGLKNANWFYLTAIAFIASIYAYQSTRLIVPLLGIGFLLFYFRNVFVKKIIPIIIISTILILPLTLVIFSSKGLSRFEGVSIFFDKGPLNRVNQERGFHENPNSIEGKIIHNKYLAYSYNFLDNYFDHFTPNFLFIAGDPLGRNKIPETGQLYFFEIFTLLFGAFFLIKKGNYSNSKIILIWLLVAPVASSLTYQSPHALRSHNMVIPLALISGLGFAGIISLIKNSKRYIKMGSVICLVFLVGYFFVTFLHNYYVHLPKRYGLEWQCGFSEASKYIFGNFEKYDKVIATTRYDQPYILYLFYSKYDPAKYQSLQKEIGDNQFGFITISKFDKFEFRKFSEVETRDVRGKMYIASFEDIIDPNKQILKQVNYPNGIPAFRIIGEEK